MMSSIGCCVGQPGTTRRRRRFAAPTAVYYISHVNGMRCAVLDGSEQVRRGLNKFCLTNLKMRTPPSWLHGHNMMQDREQIQKDKNRQLITMK